MEKSDTANGTEKETTILDMEEQKNYESNKSRNSKRAAQRKTNHYSEFEYWKYSELRDTRPEASLVCDWFLF